VLSSRLVGLTMTETENTPLFASSLLRRPPTDRNAPGSYRVSPINTVRI